MGNLENVKDDNINKKRSIVGEGDIHENPQAYTME